MRSSTVTRGTVVSTGRCGGGEGGTYRTYDVQFVDNKGQTQVENISSCDSNIGDLSVGDSIPILYAPDDPTVIAVQDQFTDQVQFDKGVVVGEVVLIIGMTLAILLLQLRRYLMVHQKPSPAQGNWLISRILHVILGFIMQYLPGASGSYKVTIIYVKTGWLSRIPVRVREAETNEACYVDLAEPVEIAGISIDECLGSDTASVPMMRVAREHFACALLMKAGYRYEEARRLSWETRVFLTLNAGTTSPR